MTFQKRDKVIVNGEKGVIIASSENNTFNVKFANKIENSIPAEIIKLQCDVPVKYLGEAANMKKYVYLNRIYNRLCDAFYYYSEYYMKSELMRSTSSIMTDKNDGVCKAIQIKDEEMESKEQSMFRKANNATSLKRIQEYVQATSTNLKNIDTYFLKVIEYLISKCDQPHLTLDSFRPALNIAIGLKGMEKQRNDDILINDRDFKMCLIYNYSTATFEPIGGWSFSFRIESNFMDIFSWFIATFLFENVPAVKFKDFRDKMQFIIENRVSNYESIPSEIISPELNAFLKRVLVEKMEKENISEFKERCSTIFVYNGEVKGAKVNGKVNCLLKDTVMESLDAMRQQLHIEKYSIIDRTIDMLFTYSTFPKIGMTMYNYYEMFNYNLIWKDASLYETLRLLEDNFGTKQTEESFFTVKYVNTFLNSTQQGIMKLLMDNLVEYDEENNMKLMFDGKPTFCLVTESDTEYKCHRFAFNVIEELETRTPLYVVITINHVEIPKGNDVSVSSIKYYEESINIFLEKSVNLADRTVVDSMFNAAVGREAGVNRQGGRKKTRRRRMHKKGRTHKKKISMKKRKQNKKNRKKTYRRRK